MATALKRHRLSTLAFAALQSLFASAIAFAQDVNITGTTTKTTTTVWYGQWWIWAIGIAVFLIIIVALTNRGSRA